MATALRHSPGRSGSAVTRRRFLGVVSSSEPDVARHWLRIERRAMACRFELTLDQADTAFVPAAQAALKQVGAIEAQLTVFRETSAIVELNTRAASAATSCDADLFALLTRCGELSRDTEGAFDITSTPLSRCWGFLRREGRVPSDSEIECARDLVGMRHVALDPDRSTVRFAKTGVELNMGAIGKGYALDRVAATLRDAGITHALLSAGRSSTAAVGGRGRGWAIDIVSPRRVGAIARVWLRDAALGTSGAGTQFAIVDGRRYGHVLDPRSGRPADGILSASVICSSAAEADALSTAFLIGGPRLAQRYCERHPEVLVLLTPDDDASTTLVIGESTHAEVAEL
jgi:thiamine biosynthesis lipoprotein